MIYQKFYPRKERHRLWKHLFPWIPFKADWVSFPVAEKEPLTVTITNTGKKVLKIEAKGHITVKIPCDKCLKEVPTEFPVDMEQESGYEGFRGRQDKRLR